MNAVDEQAGLLRAIIDQPEDDTVRLVYADWLDENGQPERAEFIRVQVELARLTKPRELFVSDGAGKMLEGLGVALTPRGDGHYSVSTAARGLSIGTFAEGERVDIYAHLARNNRILWMRGMRYIKTIENRAEIIFRKDAHSGSWAGIGLEARSSALLTANRAAWFKVPCETCAGKGVIESRWRIAEMDSDDYGLSTSGCPACRGTGDAGGLTWEVYNTETLVRQSIVVEFRRGFPFRVTVPRMAHGVYYTPPKWNSQESSTPTPWLKAIVAHAPIEEVVFLDRVPFGDTHSSTLFGWGSPAESELRYRLHQTVFDAIEGHTNRDYLESQWKFFQTREAAITALARAVVQFARNAK